MVHPAKYQTTEYLDPYIFYIRGSIRWGYTFEEGYSIASIGVGVADFTLHTPKLFGSLPKDSLLNPDILWI